MAHANADRNLLFGILALQLDFISRDALVHAMNAWVMEKTKSLGQILLEQSALTADSHALLEAMVQKHLALHDNDPEKSLAALPPAAAVQAQLREVTDPDVQSTLVRMAAVTSEIDPFATRPPMASTPKATGLRYRILRPCAQGGLGEVFIAQDEELNREVALKEIKSEHADSPEIRSRFLLEATLTGGLEHPCIVPVYGMGQYADGRPYYAMRFIRGDSLKDAINRFHESDPAALDGERGVQFRQLLGCFVDVCNAVAYAHSRGVLHRDLKPANVMLGKYGETLLLDWGLAKPIGTKVQTHPLEERTLHPPADLTRAETLAGSTLGTPHFMSPEQAGGALDLLGPATDIYSLGAMLYALLTGKTPFEESDLGLLLHKVQTGTFPPPRKVNATVPPPLEAICLKAMQMVPAERYPSARALADDIEHWLADEPVSVYREPALTRLARWARHHRPLVAGLAGLLLTAVVALAISTLLISQEQQRTMEQRRHAEENFQTALRAVNDMLTEVAEGQLADEPRMEQKRRVLLAKARSYYQHFLEQRGSDPELRKETALAQQRLGDISRLLGENQPAQEAYDQAIALLTPLSAETNDASMRRQLAESWCNLGEVLRTTSKTTAARNAYQRALDIQQRLAAENPDQPRYRQDLARTDYNLGILARDTQQPQEAEKALNQSIALLTRLVDEFPHEPAYRQHLARGYLNLGPVLRALGRTAEAEATYRKAIDLQKGLVEKDPLSPAYRYELAVTDNNLGFLLEKEKRYPEAVKLYRHAGGLLDNLVVQFPSVPVYAKEGANTQNNLAIALAHSGDKTAAEDAWRGALTQFEKLAAAHPDVPAYEGSQGMVQGNLGWLRLQQKDAAGARPLLEMGIRHVQAALKANPDNPVYRQTLRDQYGYLIECLTALGKDAAAAAAKKELAELEAGKPR